MSEPNPNGCCGVDTLCCDGKIPDRLMATVSTDCGDYEIPLILEIVSLDEVRWTGEGDIECTPPAGTECGPATATVLLLCKGDWVLALCGVTVNEFTVNCEPFSASGNVDGFHCSCAQTVDVSVTE